MEMWRFQFLYFQLKNSTPVFWERFLFFRKRVLMFELLKTFKFSSDCHIKACQPLKQRAISKISSNFFLKEPMLFLLALKWNLLDKAFACVKPKTSSNFAVKFLKGATFCLMNHLIQTSVLFIMWQWNVSNSIDFVKICKRSEAARHLLQ